MDTRITRERVSNVSGVTSMCWWCAGATKDLLLRYPTEHSKYFGIGLAVLLTGLLAALSGGYAIFTVFDEKFLAIPMGVLWGVTVFNIDRYLVSTMHKTGDGSVDFWRATPRLLLAVAIALTISKPLELRIFEKEIDQLVVEESKEYRDVEDLRLSEIHMGKYQRQLDDLELELAKKNGLVDEQRKVLEQEVQGVGGSKVYGEGIASRLIRRNLQAMILERDALSKRIVLVKTKMVASEDMKNAAVELAVEQSQSAQTGFIARLEALERLKRNNVVRLADLFIMLLFILLESAPVLAKLTSSRGPYEAEVLATSKALFSVIQHDADAIVELSKHYYEGVAAHERGVHEQWVKSSAKARMSRVKSVSKAWAGTTASLASLWSDARVQCFDFFGVAAGSYESSQHQAANDDDKVARFLGENLKRNIFSFIFLGLVGGMVYMFTNDIAVTSSSTLVAYVVKTVAENSIIS